MVLVIGATGMVGSEVCRLLAARGERVAALARSTSNPGKLEHLRGLGATIVRGDLRDRASLAAACRGATAVVVTASSIPFGYVPGENTPFTTDRDGVLDLIDAARAAGVRHVIYTSFPPSPAAFPLQDAKRAVEAHLRASGVTYTILQPTYFMEVWLSPAVGFDAANAKATLYGTGENPISWISFLDVAQFAAASLENPAARNATLPLGGPAALSPRAVVATFERLGTRRFDVTTVPVEALEARRAAAADPLEQTFAALMIGYAQASPIEMSATLKTFPIAMKTIEDHVRGVLAGQG
jgi:NADH dehydrogenase